MALISGANTTTVLTVGDLYPVTVTITPALTEPLSEEGHARLVNRFQTMILPNTIAGAQYDQPTGALAMVVRINSGNALATYGDLLTALGAAPAWEGYTFVPIPHIGPIPPYGATVVWPKKPWYTNMYLWLGVVGVLILVGVIRPQGSRRRRR